MVFSERGRVGSKAEVVDRERIDEAKSVLMPCAATNDTLEESEVSGSDQEDSSWISWFCNLRANKFLCEVDENFILDDFNLYGLSHQVPYYDYALNLILDEDSSSDGEIITEEQNELIESAAEKLYGMIHARYILTETGLYFMSRKFSKKEFGTCPSVYCRRQACLPVGLSDIPRASTVKLYCPKCEDVFHPPSEYPASNGAYFGTTFSHLFIMTEMSHKQKKVLQSYVPRVFGFKLHKLSSEKQKEEEYY